MSMRMRMPMPILDPITITITIPFQVMPGKPWKNLEELIKAKKVPGEWPAAHKHWGSWSKKLKTWHTTLPIWLRNGPVTVLFSFDTVPFNTYEAPSHVATCPRGADTIVWCTGMHACTHTCTHKYMHTCAHVHMYVACTGYINKGVTCFRGVKMYSKCCTISWSKCPCRAHWTNMGCHLHQDPHSISNIRDNACKAIIEQLKIASHPNVD